MKIKALQTYQYVKFNKKNENFFSGDKVDMKGLEIEYIGDGQIRIQSPLDHVIVYTTNVAYSVPMTTETAAKKITAAPKLPNNDPAVKTIKNG